MADITLVVRVERFPGERQVGFTERLVLGRVGVHEGGDVLGVGLPVDDQLGLADLLAKGTSLAAMIPTAISGSIANARRGLLDVRAGLVVGLCATGFSFAGVALSFLLPARISGVLFAALLLLAALQLALKGRRKRS